VLRTASEGGSSADADEDTTAGERARRRAGDGTANDPATEASVAQERKDRAQGLERLADAPLRISSLDPSSPFVGE